MKFSFLFLGHKSKVRFPEDQIIEDESTSIVGKVSGDKIRISLGFLQFHHRYHINLRIDHFLGDELASDPSLNPNVQLLESNLNETGENTSQIKILHLLRVPIDTIPLDIPSNFCVDQPVYRHHSSSSFCLSRYHPTFPNCLQHSGVTTPWQLHYIALSLFQTPLKPKVTWGDKG